MVVFLKILKIYFLKNPIFYPWFLLLKRYFCKEDILWISCEPNHFFGQENCIFQKLNFCISLRNNERFDKTRRKTLFILKCSMKNTFFSLKISFIVLTEYLFIYNFDNIKSWLYAKPHFFTLSNIFQKFVFRWKR